MSDFMFPSESHFYLATLRDEAKMHPGQCFAGFCKLYDARRGLKAEAVETWDANNVKYDFWVSTYLFSSWNVMLHEELKAGLSNKIC